MDLLNKLNNQSKESADKGSGERSEPAANNTQQASQKPSDTENLIEKASADTASPKATSVNADSKTELNESASSDSSNDSEKDTSTWSVESALKEIKKLREENKQYRIKYSERENRLKEQKEEELRSVLDKQKELEEAAKELQSLKEKEADKKRSLEEKVDHRNKRIAQLEADLEVVKRQYNDKLSKTSSELEDYKIKIEAQNEVYKKRVQEELESISEDYKEIAQSIVDGAPTPEDALLRLTNAKYKGIFEDKSVVVNHSVPGASQGARATNEQIEENKRNAKSKLSSQDKIREALKDVKGNSAIKFTR